MSARFLPILLLASSLLSACQTEDVQLERREITAIEQVNATNQGMVPNVSKNVISQVSPAYVTLTVSRVNKFGTARDHDNRAAVTSGSGFMVSSDGFMLTAAHVAVAPGNLVSARAANGRVYTGSVIQTLPSNDTALIKLRGYKGSAVQPTSSACVPKNAPLFTLGKPHAQGDTARFGTLASMTFGQPVQYGAFGYPDAMVLRMNTQKGESGGPVFNGDGRLVGMVVSTLSDANGQPLNLAHAVPVAKLAAFLCSNTQCSVNWASLAKEVDKPCP